jgi:SAM-dependent methyltransferase
MPETTTYFKIPPKELFQPNDENDPLPYYYRPLIGKLFRSRIEQGLSLLSPPYNQILEIGYGSGLVLPSLCALGQKVTAVDICSEPDKIIKPLSQMDCHCELIKCNFSEAAFEQESFDLVVAFSILEHIEDILPVVNQVHSILKPGGHFLVGMPRVDYLMEKAFKLIGYDNINDHHVTNYRQCMAACRNLMTLQKMTWIPSMVPEFSALYYNMLFSKAC